MPHVGLSPGALHLPQAGSRGLPEQFWAFPSNPSSLRGCHRECLHATKEVPFHYYPEMSQFQLPSIYTQGITADPRIPEGNVSMRSLPLRIIPVPTFNPGADPLL